MNAWFDDARVRQAEVDSFEAERAERRGAFSEARALYDRAAENLAAVALSVPPDHPNTRGRLAIAALAAALRAGSIGMALNFAARVLAEPAALDAASRREIEAIELDETARLSRLEGVGPPPTERRDIEVRRLAREPFRGAA